MTKKTNLDRACSTAGGIASHYGLHGLKNPLKSRTWGRVSVLVMTSPGISESNGGFWTMGTKRINNYIDSIDP
jgi:hypothetical protein